MQPDFLQPDEKPLGVQPRDPRSAIDAWLGILLFVVVVCAGAFVVAAFVDARAVPYAIATAAVTFVLGGVWAVAVWFRVRSSVNVVTADRVYHAHGVWRYHLSQTTYDRVTDLHVHQSLFGRRFGFGTVLVQTAGQGVALVGVRDPLGTKRLIEEAREAMVRRLVAAHKRTTKATAAGAGSVPAAVPRPAIGGPPAWTGAPTLASLLAQVVPMLVSLVFFAVFFLATSPFTGPIGLIVPAAVVLFLAIGGASAVIRMRTTRYEVHPWGVAVASGWLSRRRVEARYEKVTDVAVTQGVWGRMLGFGSIRINTAGGAEAPIAFDGVRDPDQVKAIVDGARQGTRP